MSLYETLATKRSWLVCGGLVLAVGLCARFSIGETAESNSNAADALKASFAKYKTWEATTAKPFLVSSNGDCRPNGWKPPGPHGDRYIQVYVSDSARDMFVAGNPKQGLFPEGAVIVKQKRLKANDDKLVELGVMIKLKKGSSPKTKDWQYLFVDPDGKLASDKTLQNCAACHANAKNDSVFGREPAFMSLNRK
jgi:hypothetical protein